MTKSKLAIIILGNRNSGKSSTFYELFGKRIRTGYKRLELSEKEIELFVQNSSFEETGKNVSSEVFVRNSSFEEYGDNIEKFFVKGSLPNIVLCAVQYKEKGLKTIDYFKNNGYYLYIQWLNPGYSDHIMYSDKLHFEERYSQFGEFHKVSGKEKKIRIQEIKNKLISHIIR